MGKRLVNEFWDVRSLLEYRRRGEISLSSWFGSVVGRNVGYAHFSRDDPIPFLELIAHMARDWIRA